MIKTKNVRSPITGSKNIYLEKIIKTSLIIEEYKKSQMNIDVSKYFKNIEEIFVYKCLDTGYRFYYPFNTNGDHKFYENLENFPWYYMDWKWEHEMASNIIKPKDQVLEIGCGRGSFLRKMQQKGADCAGLELNENAVLCRQDKKVRVLNESIQEHTINNHEKYDVVCSFQVVEHIAKVKEFLQASVDAVKPGGTLIISVPNNYIDSIILKDNLLNMPPHHMGLWDAVSLANLQSIFSIRLEKLEMEPIQKYHFGYYQSFLENLFVQKYRFWGKVFRKVASFIILNNLNDLSKYILGHTILAQYKKL